jgi:hypothetical protein
MKYYIFPPKRSPFQLNLYPQEIRYERGCAKIAQVEPPRGQVHSFGGVSLVFAEIAKRAVASS